MSRRPRTSTVVFDLDGTLVDSLPLVLRAFAHAIEPFAPRPTMEIFARLGGPPERIFPSLLGGDRNLREAMGRLADFNRDNHHLIQPFTGVAVVLEKLRLRDVALAIWTGRDRDSTDRLLREHRLADFFQTVMCGDDLPSHKPDPAGLREILVRLGSSAENSLLIGDADVDVLGGAACGVDTLLINHAREVDEAVWAKTWRMVSSPFEAYELVLNRVG
jgi:phosphoglycolate phosphatase-like HAD superfamily hydrolase